MGTTSRTLGRKSSRVWLPLRGALLDHPHLWSVVLLGAVVGHCCLARRYPKIDILRGLAGGEATEMSQVSDLYISVTGVSALAAGFAGVVIVFGLQSASPRFRRFRWAGGRSLASNWMAVIATPVASSLLSLGATLGLNVDQAEASRWLFEASIVLLLHTSLRVLWLLRALANVVAADDDMDERASNRLSTKVFFGQRPTAGAPEVTAPADPSAPADR